MYSHLGTFYKKTKSIRAVRVIIMEKKKIKGVFRKVLAFAIVGCLAFAGISAYFTDADTTTNTFTVGKVSLDLQEPNWVGDKTGDAKDITPNQETAKDPQVKNDGVNEEFVFVTVSIPYANVKTALQDGTVRAAENTQLYSLLNTSGAVGINSGWYLMGYLDNTENISATPVFRDDGTVVHLYAYGTKTVMTALAADATTAPVFNKVRFANVVEDQGLEQTDLDIVVSAYGIQTTNINDAIGTGNVDGKTAPTDVWTVVQNANPSTDTAAEDAVTDIKQ